MGKRSGSILGADLAHRADRVKTAPGAADVIPIDVMDARAGRIFCSDGITAATADDAKPIMEAA